jgi:pimeloyl-ACP methyl ester carboxylesterase
MTDKQYGRFRARLSLTAVLFFVLIPSSFAEDSFFDSDGVKIHYVVEGKGEPLLLIHGFAGSTQDMLDPIKDLSNNFQVIAVDVRGHGKSEKPHNRNAYGVNLIGEKDLLKKDVDRLNGLMPNLKIVVIPKANHLTAPSDPLFKKSIKDFLAENSKSTSGSR